MELRKKYIFGRLKYFGKSFFGFFYIFVVTNDLLFHIVNSFLQAFNIHFFLLSGLFACHYAALLLGLRYVARRNVVVVFLVLSFTEFVFLMRLMFLFILAIVKMRFWLALRVEGFLMRMKVHGVIDECIEIHLDGFEMLGLEV